MAQVRIWIHAVWGTKSRTPFMQNKNKRITLFKHIKSDTEFDWADDYYAASVSQSHVEIVRNYIKNQEEHHRNKSFTEECEEFMVKYGFTRLLG